MRYLNKELWLGSIILLTVLKHSGQGQLILGAGEWGRLFHLIHMYLTQIQGLDILKLLPMLLALVIFHFLPGAIHPRLTSTGCVFTRYTRILR